MAYNKNKRLESMLFNYETTGRTDFRDGEITSPITTKYKEKGTCLRIRPPPLKDVHTLVDWAGPVPFSLYHKPKEVLRTNPRDVQKTFLQLEDEGREEAQKTRPRLIMTPAVCLDDITDNSVRDILVKDVYRSSTRIATEEGVALSRRDSVRAPLPGLPAPANPIMLKKVQPPYVSPEWRMDSVSWDNRQLRAFCEPDRDFWLAQPPKCTVCKLTAEREARKKRDRQMRQRT